MCKCAPELKMPWCGKPGCETPPQKDYTVDPIFNLLNCFEIDASEVTQGTTYIGSDEAKSLTYKIRQIISQEKSV